MDDFLGFLIAFFSYTVEMFTPMFIVIGIIFFLILVILGLNFIRMQYPFEKKFKKLFQTLILIIECFLWFLISLLFLCWFWAGSFATIEGLKWFLFG